MKLKMEWTEKKIVYSMMVGVILTTILDLGTALSSPIFKLAEANPIYLLTGGSSLLLFITIGFTVWILYKLKSAISLDMIFLTTLLSLYLMFGHTIGALSNVSSTVEYHKNPEETIKQLEGYTVKEKLTVYSLVVVAFLMLPALFAFGAYYFTKKLWFQREGKREAIAWQIKKLAKKLTDG